MELERRWQKFVQTVHQLEADLMVTAFFISGQATPFAGKK
jgi:hypothetical protein